jgi:hypothetical protein
MKKVIRLTESDLVNIVKKVIMEQANNFPSGANCEIGNKYTVCSYKDSYGFAIRAFDNKTFNTESSTKRLPERALVQSAGKNWEETLNFFINNKKRGNFAEIPNPTKEPTEKIEYGF